MPQRGTRGAYRREDRVALPLELQRELVERAAARIGNCQELAKILGLPKSSVHYYRIGRLTLPVSILERMLEIADDETLKDRIVSKGISKDRLWATEYAQDIYREMCRERVRLPTREEIERDDDLRRKAAALVSYVLAEGSVWLQKGVHGEHAANITLAAHEQDLYTHFRSLCMSVFDYDLGPPQKPGNGAAAIRGFIYSRFIAEWLVNNGVPIGDKAAHSCLLPSWVMESQDLATWISAVQPWCDGEGTVARSTGGSRSSFSLAQSRHTDLDFHILTHELGWRGQAREIPGGALEGRRVFGIPVGMYLEGFARSEVFDCVATLLGRIGLKPRTSISCVYLKDDGFWSCNWIIRLRSEDTSRLPELGLVTQRRKLDAIVGRTDK